MLRRLRRGLKEAACNKVTGNQQLRHWQVNTTQSAYQLLQLANLIHYGPNNKVHVQLIKNGNKKAGRHIKLHCNQSYKLFHSGRILAFNNSAEDGW